MTAIAVPMTAGPVLVDLAALATEPLREVAPLPGLEHHQLRDVLAAAMPGVEYSRKPLHPQANEHSLIDLASGSAVRAVVVWDHYLRRSSCSIAEVGPRAMWLEVDRYVWKWERQGRRIPSLWEAPSRGGEVAAP